jgi:hypothetical protein
MAVSVGRAFDPRVYRRPGEFSNRDLGALRSRGSEGGWRALLAVIVRHTVATLLIEATMRVRTRLAWALALASAALVVVNVEQ